MRSYLKAVRVQSMEVKAFSNAPSGNLFTQNFKQSNPFATTVTTSSYDQPEKPTIPAPIHPDFDIAMSKEVRKTYSFPKKAEKGEAFSNPFSTHAKDKIAEAKPVSDFDIEPPMNKGSGLTAGASTREDASQGMASAVANVFETEQRKEELRKTTTRIVDRRRLVVDPTTGEVIARRTDKEVAQTAPPKKKGGMFGFLGGKKAKAEKQAEMDRMEGINQASRKLTTNIDDEEEQASSRSPQSVAGKKYKFFEDQYPKQAPSEAAAKRYAYFEDMEAAARVKCEEEKAAPLTETEHLHKVHDWKENKEGLTPDPSYGWAEEWGPQPGEEGHSEWYKKNRMYMSYEEKSRLDLKNGVPLEKNQFRHQEMPVHKKMKGAYEKMSQEKGGPQMYGMNERKYDASHTYEDKKDFLMTARDDYMQEWLAKPGVTPENMAKKIGEYNGTGKKQNVVPVQRKPEWEIAPIIDD